MATRHLQDYKGERMMADEEDDHDHDVTPQGFGIQRQNSDVNVKYQRYPYCIVWTPIPLISWLIPVIGHTGIATADGVIHDFAGSNFVSVDDFAFGDPHKYVQLEPEMDASTWDSCIKKADDKYADEAHNLITNNCHSHVANVLNHARYKGKTDWNMVSVWLLTVTQSKYVNIKYCLRTYLAFLLLLAFYFIFLK